MKIHVLMCCHNGARFVAEQLTSILSQSQPVDVVHIFDFASVDDTVEVLRSTAAKYSHVVIHVHEIQDAPGASLSFFRGFATLAEHVANNDCILLADQDDVWLPHKLATLRVPFEQLYALTSGGRVAVFHDVYVVNEQLETLSDTFYTGNPYSVPRDLAPDRLLLCNPVIGHTLAISGALLKAVVTELTPAQYLMHDWATVLLVSRTGRIEFIPGAPLSLYRQHANNVLGAHRRRSLSEMLARTAHFSGLVVNQALGFAHDKARLAQQDSGQGKFVDRLLVGLGPATGWMVFPLLAACAMLRGPTLKRRGLGLFILLDGVQRLIRRGGGARVVDGRSS